MKRLIFFLTLTFTFTFTFTYSFASDLKGSKVVAIVNGSAITRDDLDREVNRLLPQKFFHHRNVTAERQKEIEKKALENLINRELFYFEAKKQGIKINRSEIRKRLDAVRSEFQTRRAFEDALRDAGMTRDSLQEGIKKDMMIEKLLEKEVRVNLTDNDLKDYYRKNTEKFKQPESVKLRYIYIAINPSEPDGRKKAKDRAESAYSKIMSGMDFASIAQTYSHDMSRINGGDMGFVHKGRIMDLELERVAFSLKVGQTSEILETDKGYHILKIEDKRPPRQVPFEEVKDKLKKELTESMQERKLEGLIKRLRENAKIQ